MRYTYLKLENQHQIIALSDALCIRMKTYLEYILWKCLLACFNDITWAMPIHLTANGWEWSLQLERWGGKNYRVLPQP